MPSRRSGNDLVLFSSGDPQQLVNWLCETYGLATILQSVAEFRPAASSGEAPAKRAYKRRGRKPGPKKGSKRGAKAGAKAGAKKGSGKRRGRPPGSGKKQAEGDAGGNG
jgi:hypothetical protein